MSDPINSHKLDKLAEVAVKVGLQLAEGQDLVMTASLEAAPLARLITKHAYKSGAGLVTTLFSDPEATLMRYRHARNASFDRAAGWLFDGISKAFDDNAARLAISGDNPALLADEDPDKVSRADRAMKAAANAMRKRIVEFHINWNIVAYPGLDWARQVFAGEPDAVAQEKLANAVFAASRVDVDDPMAAWAAHNANLAKRSAWLNGQNFSALHFIGPGTDLKVGLAEAHRWMGGASKARNGIVC
ncbi:MAG TPA: aminopeptidase, partial [Devosia sp.]|nr:aminopeptidase [Devosia sp.]